MATTTAWEVCGYCGASCPAPAFASSVYHLKGCVRHRCEHGKPAGECKRKSCK